MYFLHAINSDRQTRLLNVLGQIAMILGDKKHLNVSCANFLNNESTTRSLQDINPLTPNDHYSGRTATLTSKRCILYVYSTNIGIKYFKHGIYSPFFPFRMQFVS